MAREPMNAAYPRSNFLISAAVVVAGLYFGRGILLPFALAILIGFLLAPLVERLERWQVRRVPAVLTVATLAFLAMAGLGYVVAQQAYDLAYNLPAYKDNIVKKAQALQGTGDGVWNRASKAIEEVRDKLMSESPVTADGASPSEGGADDKPKTSDGDRTAEGSEKLDDKERDSSEPVPVEIVESLSARQVAEGVVGPLLAPLGSAAIVVVFVLFMLLEREDLRNRLIRLIGGDQLQQTTQALNDAAGRVSRYLLMQLIINASYGLVIAAGLFLIGLPNALLWGTLTAVLRFVPYIGPWIGASMPLAASLAVFDGWTQPALVLALFAANELISNNLLEPWLYGSSTGISTIGILASAVFWSWLWGPVGLVMATPLTVCLTVMGRYVPQLAFLNTLISDEEVLSPSARFYQRLLAMDPDEATEIAEAYLAEHSLEELYDNVVLPALSLAEQDRHQGDLDEAKQQLVHQATREIVEDLGDRSSLSAPAVVISPESLAAMDGPPAVLCLPARDDADEIAGMMLIQLLEQRGVAARTVSTRALSGEMLAQVEAESVTIVCISALPPFAATHARYLCKRLRPRFPRLKLIVGLWQTRESTKKSRDRLAAAGADKIIATLAEAVADLSARVAAQLALETAAQPQADAEPAAATSG